MENINQEPVTPEEAATGEALPTRDECNLGVLCQLLQFAGVVFPFGSLIAPLILWLLKRNESAFLDEIGKEVVNFQISLIAYSFVCGLLVFVLIGIFMLAVLGTASRSTSAPTGASSIRLCFSDWPFSISASDSQCSSC